LPGVVDEVRDEQRLRFDDVDRAEPADQPGELDRLDRSARSLNGEEIGSLGDCRGRQLRVSRVSSAIG
jgi:hypothetical protein